MIFFSHFVCLQKIQIIYVNYGFNFYSKIFSELNNIFKSKKREYSFLIFPFRNALKFDSFYLIWFSVIGFGTTLFRYCIFCLDFVSFVDNFIFKMVSMKIWYKMLYWICLFLFGIHAFGKTSYFPISSLLMNRRFTQMFLFLYFFCVDIKHCLVLFQLLFSLNPYEVQ